MLVGVSQGECQIAVVDIPACDKPGVSSPQEIPLILIIVIETVVTGNYTKLTRYTCCHMVSLGLPLRDNLMVWRLLSRCILPHIAPFPTFGNRCLSTIGSGKQRSLSVGAAPGPQGMAGAILCAQKIPELPMISSIDDAENLWHQVITWTNVDQWSSVAFTWQLHYRKCWRYPFIKWVWKLHFLKALPHLPGDNELMV